MKRARNLFVVSPAADFRAFCQSLALGELISTSSEHRSLRLRVDPELLRAAARPVPEDLRLGDNPNPQGGAILHNRPLQEGQPQQDQPQYGQPQSQEPSVYTGPDYYRPEYDGPQYDGPQYDSSESRGSQNGGAPYIQSQPSQGTPPAEGPQNYSSYQEESRESFEFSYGGPSGSLHGEYYREQRLQSLFGDRPAGEEEQNGSQPPRSDSSPDVSYIEETAERTWTDSTGRHQIVARLIAIEKNRLVVLEKKSGSTSKVPLDKLSPKDLEYITQQITLSKARTAKSNEGAATTE